VNGVEVADVPEREGAHASVDPMALLDALPDPVVVLGADVRVRWANVAATDRFGWTNEDLAGRPVDGLVHPDDLVTALSSMTSVQAKDLGTLITIRVRDAAGRYSAFEVRGRSALDHPGVGGVVLVLRDVTERRRWAVDGGDIARLQTVLDHAPGITMVLDRDGTLRGASRAFSSLLGRDLESSIGVALWDLAAPDDAAHVRAQFALASTVPRSHSFEARFSRSDRRAPMPLRLTAVNLLDDRTMDGIVVTAVDITSLVTARDRLDHMARHDSLTDALNRMAFHERLDGAIASARRRGAPLSVLFCDIDGFKAVNDDFGHRAGDEVLVEIARRLRRATREADLVGRYGGDEFVLALVDGDQDTLSVVLDRVRALLDAPIRLANGAELHVRTSLGWATDDRSGDAEDLLARADAAMYLSKRGR
jgi:diguanylate cyclase (GGDEF)-like protein/PAS domain S-box-containing protein